MTDTPTILSAIQPTGDMTLGNYLGAIRNHVAMYKQNNDALFFVVDLHALTVRQDPKLLRERTYSVLAWYLAAGLDPDKCTLFVQSHVPEHTELAWLLGTFTQMGELERMTQFKDKAQRHKHNINAGLFTYPVLMAADILLYDTHKVPVGEDQKQHIELARDVAIRFNNTYDKKGKNPIFVVPEPTIAKVAARVMDLQNPTAKMSKSVESQGTVFLNDDLKVAAKKFKRAVTDNLASIANNRAEQPGITNLLGILAALQDSDVDSVAASFAGKGYGDLKSAVADAVVAELEPLQKRHQELMADTDYLDKVLAKGAKKARARAGEKLVKVKEVMGLIPSRV